MTYGEVTLQLRPLPDSQWITQDHTAQTSTISLAQAADDAGLTAFVVASVTLNGRQLRHAMRDPLTISVSPCVPLQADRLAIRCLVACEPSKPLEVPPAAYPLGRDGYGLQAPIRPTSRGFA